MSTTIQETHSRESVTGSMDVLAAAMCGTVLAGVVLGFTVAVVLVTSMGGGSLTSGYLSGVGLWGLVGAVVGLMWAVFATACVLPIAAAVAANASTERELVRTHTLGGAATGLAACLPTLLGTNEPIAWLLAVVPMLFGAAGATIAVSRCIRKKSIKVEDDAEDTFLRRMTR